MVSTILFFAFCFSVFVSVYNRIWFKKQLDKLEMQREEDLQSVTRVLKGLALSSEDVIKWQSQVNTLLGTIVEKVFDIKEKSRYSEKTSENLTSPSKKNKKLD
jgi:flagellar biosynthesis chaperone FliJ